MAKTDLLNFLKDINYVYNDCGMYDCVSKMLEDFEAEIRAKLHDSNTSVLSDDMAWRRGVKDAYIEVREVAKEYGNGWIPCEVALPKEATTYEVTCEIILCSKKQYITTYALWGTEGEWICRKNERVIAWKEKSAPYQKGE
jgi:hypothetical protein